MQKSPCADGNWVGSKQYTHACYSDVVPLWSDERLDVGDIPYRDNGVEYPVLVGAFMWLSTGLTLPASTCSPVSRTSRCSAASPPCCSAVRADGRRRDGWSGRRRPYDAALFALSPLLVFHAFSNWDLLAMAFASCALWAWAREKPVAAGVLIGLGTAAKLYPVFLLVPILILAWRTGRWREACGRWLSRAELAGRQRRRSPSGITQDGVSSTHSAPHEAPRPAPSGTWATT